MRTTLALLAILMMAACSPPEPPPVPGGPAAGMVIGSRYDDSPLTIGKGELADHALVITYFATW